MMCFFRELNWYFSKKLSIVVAAITILLAFAANGNSEHIQTYELPTIVVLGQVEEELEYANNFRVIDSSSIFMGPTSSDNLEQLTFIESAIRFSGSERSNGQEINLRGFSSKNVITAIDGVKTRFYSQHDGSVFIDPLFISNVAIYKGANSHIYGSGGIGGYISYNTIGFEEVLSASKEYGILAKAGFETADKDRNIMLGYATRFGPNNKVMVLGLKRKSSDIKLSDGGKLLADDDIHSVLLKSELNLFESHQVLVNYHFYQNDAVEPNNPQIWEVEAELTGTRADVKFAQLTNKKVRNHGISLMHKYAGSGDVFGEFNVDTTFYLQNVLVKKEEITSDGIDPLGTQKEREIESYGVDSVVNLGSWFVGLELNRDIQNGTKNRKLSSLTPSGRTNSLGVFAGKNFLFLEDKAYNLQITPTLRFDNFNLKNGVNNRDDSELSYSLKALLEGNDKSFYASISKSFRAPNITELFADGEHFRAGPPFSPLINNFVMNPYIKPEKGISYEVGFTHKANGMIFNNEYESGAKEDSNIFKVSLYYTDYNNYIDQKVIGNNISSSVCPFPTAANPLCSAGITQFLNVEKATIKGFEIEDTYSYKSFRYIVSLAKSLGNNKSTQEGLGNQIPLTLSNELQYEYEKWLFGVQAKFADRLSANKLAGYGVFNAAAVYNLDNNLKFSLKVDNIFDKEYAKTYSNVFARARTLKVQLSYNW